MFIAGQTGERGRAAAGAGGDAAREAARTAAADLPVYLTNEFSFVILGFWLIVPLIVGYRVFNGADLE